MLQLFRQRAGSPGEAVECHFRQLGRRHDGGCCVLGAMGSSRLQTAPIDGPCSPNPPHTLPFTRAIGILSEKRHGHARRVQRVDWR